MESFMLADFCSQYITDEENQSEIVYVIEDVNISETLYPELVHELINVFPINRTGTLVTEDDAEDENTSEVLESETEESENEVFDDNMDIVPLWDAIENFPVVESKVEAEYRERGCCKNNCVKQFSVDDLKSFRMQCAELDNYKNSINMLDTIILFKLQSLVYDDDKITHAGRTSINPRQRLRVNYCMRGLSVCREAFLFCHGISHKRLHRLLHVFKSEGPGRKHHGNRRKTPVNDTPFSSAQHVVTFLRNYAETFALFIPGRIAQKYAIVKLLPIGLTKKYVYEEYQLACEAESSISAVSFPIFRQLWRTLCADIVITIPRSDLCSFCHSLCLSSNEYAGESDTVKSLFLRKIEEHLNFVKAEHEAYCATVLASRELLQASIANGFSMSVDSRILNLYRHRVHLSFDFTQQIQLPNLKQKPGPIYFFKPYKVEIFGIMNDTLKVQHNFVIPESILVSKGVNSIISYLHYYLENYLPGVDVLELQADNCVIQNKNNLILAYLQWRILTGKNSRIMYHFLPVGHAKFMCNMAFGVFKKTLSYNEAHTVDDVLQIFEKSTPESKLNRAIKCGTEQGHVLVPIYDWKHYFRNQYKLSGISQITKYAYFTFNIKSKADVRVQENKNDPGLVYRLFNEEQAGDPNFRSLKNLSQITPTAFSNIRKKYLYDNIRQFVREDAKDILCPKPVGDYLREAPVAVDVPNLTENITVPKKKKKKIMKVEVYRNDDDLK